MAGPILPQRAKTARQARSALANTAFQVGVLLSIQRNRLGKRQGDLAAEIRCAQPDISRLERGLPPAKPLSDLQLKRLFKTLELADENQLRGFLKWWQTHG